MATSIVIGSITKVPSNALVPRKCMFEKVSEFIGEDFDFLGDTLAKLDPDVYWPYVGGIASLEQAKKLLSEYRYVYEEGEASDKALKETLTSLLSFISYPTIKLEDVYLTKGVKDDDLFYMGIIFFYTKVAVRPASEFQIQERKLRVSAESLEKAILEIANRIQTSRVLGMDIDMKSVKLSISKEEGSFTVSLS